MTRALYVVAICLKMRRKGWLSQGVCHAIKGPGLWSVSIDRSEIISDLLSMSTLAGNLPVSILFLGCMGRFAHFNN